MEKEIRILILEDLPSDAELAKRELKKAFESCLFKVVDTEKDYVDALTTYLPDLVISDYQLPAFDGMSALKFTKENYPFLPFVILTGSMNEDTAVKCMKSGADDYVIKEHLKRLSGAAQNAVKKKRIELDVHNAELALKISEEKFRVLYNSSPDMYCSESSSDSKIIYCNDTLIRKTGYSRAEIIDSPVFKLYHEDSIEEAKLASRQFIETGSVVDKELFLKTKGGEKIAVSLNVGSVKNDAGEIIHSISSWRDITYRKQIEESLKTALIKATESDRLKSAFLATMSHELRTPLNSIIGFSELITNDLSIDEAANFSSIIHASGNHLLSIVEDIFDITLIESGESQIKNQGVNLSSLLKEIQGSIIGFEQKTKESNLNFKLNIPPEGKDLIILTDPTKVKQVLINLVKNALKFTNEGQVTYGFTLEMIEKKPMIKFFIEDTGIGIHKDKLGIIFDKFRQIDDNSTRQHEGTGIGLSIAKKITELLQGEIWAESVLGEGSTFYFTIPLIKDEGHSGSKIGGTSNYLLKNKTVLIVEDDESSYEYLKFLIDNQGMKILWADNGEKAIKYCEENPSLDLIFMDINMPVMNGYEAVKKIRKFNKEVVIIAQTAYALFGDREKAIKAGCNDYIAKPIRRNELLLLLQKNFNKQKD